MIGAECAFVRVSGELLISGSKSGEVACWELRSGKEMWRSKFEGPCSNADSNKDFLFVTESDRVHAIMLASGEEVGALSWRVRAILLEFHRKAF